MARDGSGTYSLPATMAVSNEVASSATVNSIMEDIAQALTDSLNKDGSKALAANLPMGGYKITGLGAATALSDAAQLSQVQKGEIQRATTVGGTVDAITLTFTPAITSYTTGMVIRWRSGGANTVTAPTVNVNSIGAKTIKKNPGSAALVAGDLGVAGTERYAIYNGTDFILLNPPIPERASTTEVLTGTNTDKAVTPDALAALWEQGADIASAGTITIGEGGSFAVTGTTTITDIDLTTDRDGRPFVLRFSDSLTLTHGAALFLPGNANIVTQAGDHGLFIATGTDLVRCIAYFRDSGRAVVEVGAVLLGTITAGTGTSATLGWLDLTTYSAIELHFYGVSISTTGTILCGNSTSDDVAITLSSGAAIALTGRVFIGLSDGIGVSELGDEGGAVSVMNFNTALSSATTTISVAPSAGNFDAGTIRVWGYKG